MTDVFSPEMRSAVMRAVHSKDTTPELAVRRSLHAHGFRYRLHVKALPGKPDIVLARFRAVIQVRGCFWHCHTCAAGQWPSSRLEYWQAKLAANKVRDLRNDRRLRALGWKVITVWECRTHPGATLQREIARVIRLLEASKPLTAGC